MSNILFLGFETELGGVAETISRITDSHRHYTEKNKENKNGRRFETTGERYRTG